MFFSVFNYSTKQIKKETLEFRETYNNAKKAYTFPVILCNNIKNKLIRDVRGLASSAPLR